MKKTLYILIGFLALSCLDKVNSTDKSDLAIDSTTKPIEIYYKKSKEETIEKLKKIWGSNNVFIAKSEVNFNGEVSNNISLMISGTPANKLEINKEEIKLTSALIKKSILNYKAFSKLKIICSYKTSSGETKTSSQSIKMTVL